MGNLTRRRFLSTTALGAAGLITAPRLAAPGRARAATRSSRVVRTTDPAATSGWTYIDQETVDRMVHWAVRDLTGLPVTAEAWKSLFPGITTAKKIAIKINLACGDVPTHPQVVNAIIDGILMMDLGGGAHLPPEQIIVHDLDNAFFCAQTGYAVNYGGPGVQYFGTDHPGVGFDGAYSFPIYHPLGVVTWHSPSRIITQMCDYLVNASVIKDHNDAGVTLGLKNHFGSFNGIAVYQTHRSSTWGDGHARTEPELSRLLRDELGNKQKLFVIDGTFGLRSGGPGNIPPYHTPPNWAFNSVMVGTDTVAVDRMGTVELNLERAKVGLPALNPSHVSAAAQPPYSLGTDDPAQIDYRVIHVAETSGAEELPSDNAAPILLSPVPNPMRGRGELRLHCPTAVAAELAVFDASGRCVRRLAARRFDAGTHRIAWDGADDRGARVSAGSYFCRLRSGDGEVTRRIVVL